MARLSEKHPAFRTKDQIVRDVTFVLNSPVSYGTKLAVLNNVAWVWTEFHGKYKGCPYWSKLALGKRQHDPKAKLLHEHAVPKRVVVKMLLDLQPATADRVGEICDRFLIGVVVTPEEDGVLNVYFGKSMPEEFFQPDHPSFGDPWLRYRRCGIEVASLCGGPDPDIKRLTPDQVLNA